ncbi:hypothetical protein ACWOA6_06295 [Globicatella sulfidifaciens]|uniref:Uncharacterized protein n=1 Tax=Globicatella sulfidifaciens DSM 15739 TaxID=1121925 RepID=A0A1T4MU74_9LACT|nr:hypothetical protein [Globicatella sulfidifaciens]SJZ70377.1 hypothetical protein SAMN02746011_01538 [Globicatella sulfidifaciens DSM 15739]
MSLIELGALASALVAVITLITKLYNLIAAIQQLIVRLDFLQSEINHHHLIQKQLIKLYDHHEQRLNRVEQIQKRGNQDAA